MAYTDKHGKIRKAAREIVPWLSSFKSNSSQIVTWVDRLHVLGGQAEDERLAKMRRLNDFMAKYLDEVQDLTVTMHSIEFPMLNEDESDWYWYVHVRKKVFSCTGSCACWKTCGSSTSWYSHSLSNLDALMTLHRQMAATTNMQLHPGCPLAHYRVLSTVSIPFLPWLKPVYTPKQIQPNLLSVWAVSLFTALLHSSFMISLSFLAVSHHLHSLLRHPCCRGWER